MTMFILNFLMMLKPIKIIEATLDKDLSYKKHISHQLKKAYAKTSALRRRRRFLSHDAMIITTYQLRVRFKNI